jgi:biopolymer transport protein ExbB/TolQ
MWIRIKNFLRRWGLWIALGIAGLALVIRRAVVLRTLSNLRKQLSQTSQELDDALHSAAVETIDEEIKVHDVRVRRLEGEKKRIEAAIGRAEMEHTKVLEQIDKAEGWDELEKLRQEANARVRR